MPANQRTLQVFPQVIMNSLVTIPSDWSFSGGANPGWVSSLILPYDDSADPPNELSAEAPPYASTFPQTLTGLQNEIIGGTFVGNWDLTDYPDDTSDFRVSSVTLPRIYIKAPSGVQSKCTVSFWLVQFDPSVPNHFRNITAPKSFDVARGTQYVASPQASFNWNDLLIATAADESFISSKTFLSQIGFMFQVRYQAPVAGGSYDVKFAFQIDPAHPSVDPSVSSWGTDGIVISYAPSAVRRRGMLL